VGYFNKTIKGVGWMGALRGTTRALAFVRIAILARILSPAQFGLFGIASVALSFLEIVTETGISIFFIQREGKLKNYINTAWVISIVRGFFVGVLIFIFSPLVASFFHTPDAVRLLRLIAIVPIIRGFVNPALVQYQIKLEFNKEFWIKSLIFSVDSVVAVAVAYTFRSTESLVWGLVAGALTEVVFSQLFIRPRPRIVVEWRKFKKIINRGKWVTAYGIFNYSYENIDDVIVGRLLGIVSLGYYQIAYKISTLPITEIANVVAKVMVPVLIQIKNDNKRLNKAFISTMIVVLGVATPSGLLLFFYSEIIVKILLGEQWLVVTDIIKVLAMFGVIRAVVNTGYSIFIVKRKQEYITIVTLTSLFGLVIIIYPLINIYGLLGVAYSAIISTLISVPVYVYYLKKVLAK
jgi:O-antigen/teichoic acid export membrane protein